MPPIGLYENNIEAWNKELKKKTKNKKKHCFVVKYKYSDSVVITM